jgi:hypothetical protein
MRPQEYLALADSDLLEKGIRITQALDSRNRIGPPKSRAGRRYILVILGHSRLSPIECPERPGLLCCYFVLVRPASLHPKTRQ